MGNGHSSNIVQNSVGRLPPVKGLGVVTVVSFLGWYCFWTGCCDVFADKCIDFMHGEMLKAAPNV